MFDTLYIGMSGMDAFSRGLKVISNNLANLNTPGFRSATLQFTDAYYQQQGAAGDAGTPGSDQQALFGSGVETLATTLNFQAGDTQASSNPLDVAVSGNGYLVARSADGKATTYTRDGGMRFDDSGDLVSTTTGKYIMGYANDASSTLVRISLDGLRTNPAKATGKVAFTGNLTSTASTTAGAPPTPATASFAITDALGGAHSLTATFTQSTDTTTSSSQTTWQVAITDGSANVGSGTIGFIGGEPDPADDEFSFAYTPAGQAAMNVTLDFSSNVTSFATGNLSTLAVASQDGYGAGSISKTTFDGDGKLTITYSNGQTATGAQLALAQVDSDADLQQSGAGEFTVADGARLRLGRANVGGAGSIAAGEIEMSNVDLSGEFSNLIVMQRGYQASSEVLSTVNDMLQQLFQVRGSQ